MLLRTLPETVDLRDELSDPSLVGHLEDYLTKRAAGLRKFASEPLCAFASDAAEWTFDDRAALVRWIGTPYIARAGLDQSWSFQHTGHPVFRSVVVPTLQEWSTRSPTDPLPIFLGCVFDLAPAGRLPCLALLVEQHQDYQPARRALIRGLLDRIAFNQHELPHGYLGSPYVDLLVTEEVRRLLLMVDDQAWRKTAERWCQQQREILGPRVDMPSGDAPPNSR